MCGVIDDVSGVVIAESKPEVDVTRAIGNGEECGTTRELFDEGVYVVCCDIVVLAMA